MTRHGSESFFVGQPDEETLLDESLGGRERPQAALEGAPDFRFSRQEVASGTVGEAH
jgi:hypothetical protein